jgi:iron complex transport system ATP-binding protein
MTALQIRDLSVRLGGRAVLAGLSLDLPPASLVAVVGPNGAGKTSLLRALVGLVPAAGTIAAAGQDLARLSARERARRIAYLPQGHEVHWPLPARDIVALGRFPHGAADPDRLSDADRLAVADAMRLTETEHLADRPVTALSGGERARVALARVFASGAAIILADEPTAALDPRHQLDVMAALQARARAGALVVAVTHDLGLAARYADAVAALQGGRVARFGPPGEALAPDLLRDVFGIEAYFGAHQGAPVLVPWA